MRPRRPGLRSTANLTGMLHLDVPREADEETLIDKRLDALRFFPLCFISWVGRLAVKRMQRRGRYISSGVLSNLDRLPIAEFRGGGFAAQTGFFIPPGVDSRPLFLALCGNDEGLELAATMPEVLASEGRLEKLLDGLLAC